MRGWVWAMWAGSTDEEALALSPQVERGALAEREKQGQERGAGS